MVVSEEEEKEEEEEKRKELRRKALRVVLCHIFFWFGHSHNEGNTSSMLTPLQLTLMCYLLGF